MILEWNSVATREFHLEWKTVWLVRARNVVSIIVLVPRGPRSCWTTSLMKTDTLPFPEVSVLERVECVFLLMTYNTHRRQQYQQNKEQKKNLKRVFEHPTAPNSQASLFRPYESGRRGRLYMPSNCNGNWTLNTNWTVQLTVITNLR